MCLNYDSLFLTWRAAQQGIVNGFSHVDIGCLQDACVQDQGLQQMNLILTVLNMRVAVIINDIGQLRDCLETMLHGLWWK